ncbi:MAG: FG-GAP-like repeat-containing protein [Persicimonas sp.]
MLALRRHFFFFPLVLLLGASTLHCGSCDEGTVNTNSDSDAALTDDATDDADDQDVSTPDADDTGDEDTDAAECTGTACGDQCCEGGEECVEDQCLPACAGTRCGEDLGLCCEGSELCLGDSCVMPGDDCERTEQCPVEEICEPTVGKCVPRSSVEVCEFIPPVGEFTPEISCSWPSGTPEVNGGRIHVVNNPLVANLTDDNGDGLTNTEDVPDIVFLTRSPGCCNKPGTLRIVSGECNADGSMNEIASLNSAPMINDGPAALGDLTGNGVPEIAAISYNGPTNTNDQQHPQGVVVWTRTKDDGSEWEVLWRNTEYPTYGVHSYGGAAISLADLDGDGNPEVIVGNVVLDGQTGDLKWDGVQTTNGEGGIGNNAFLGPVSSVGDVDLDGNQEVAAGNTLYDHNGAEIWTYDYTSSNSSCHGGARDNCDGFTAMADFDDDPEGEVVIVRLGEIFVINHDGTLLWKQEIPVDDCMRNGQIANEAGPPTIADFDGDGRPEIGTAAADFYTVLDMDCDADPVPDGCHSQGVLWATPNEDCSSRVTASSVFDFEGDGKAEMVYADENTFHIYDGTSGDILFSDPSHSSNTRIEMPVVADVDNDGNSEVVIPSATDQGIKVWADADDNWVRTRRIWNQHAYSVTNIDEDGHIPSHPQPNWRNGRLNSFRQNTQPGGVFDAPDLAIEEIGLGGACEGAENVNITVEVGNQGALGEGAGVPVHIFAVHDGDSTQIDSLETTRRLLPGQSETLSSAWQVPDGWWADGFSIQAVVDPDAEINECDEDNNEMDADSAVLALDQSGLEISELEAITTACGQTAQLTVELTVENTGDEIVAADAPVLIEASSSVDTVTVDTVRTSQALATGDTEEFSVSWNVPIGFMGPEFDITATVDPDGEVLECPQQHSATITAQCEPEG